MKHPMTSMVFARAVCEELGIDPINPDAPVRAVDIDTSEVGGLAKITVTFFCDRALIAKIGARLIVDPDAAQPSEKGVLE